MKDIIIETIRENSLLEGCRGLVLCVSGGADSMSLLHFFMENKGLYTSNIVVAHVNHGLREESRDEEAYLRSFCQNSGIPIEVLRADISGTKPKGKSTEEYAREVRYDFFEKVRSKYGYSHVVTAHNADDNTETVLLNLIRGCGIGGLKGIPIKRDDGIIRPLLRCTKKEIYEYCDRNGIVFFTDKTNLENLYTRNILRNEIIPMIEKINPSFGTSVANLAISAAADDSFLDALAKEKFEELSKITQNNELPLSYLQELPESLLFRVVRLYFFVNSPKIVLTKKQTDDIIYLIKKSETSKGIFLGDLYVSRGYGVLKTETVRPSDALEEKELVLGENILEGIGVLTVTERTVTAEILKNCISSEKLLTVRSRRDGDRIKLPKRPEKSLRKLFIDDKIPLAERNTVPVVSDGSDVLWVFGYGASESARSKIGDLGLYLEFLPKGHNKQIFK